jgi:hypothetical protein
MPGTFCLTWSDPGSDVRDWDVRQWLALLVALSWTAACAGPTVPTPSLAGTWSQQFSIPGPRLVLTLDASGNGNGSYAIEAGRLGSVQVAGTVTSPGVTLTIRYDFGLARRFTGALTDANHLTGTFDDVQGPVTFTRS